MSREGGVKVVFDVAGSEATRITRTVSAAGFTVRPYYQAPPRRGGPRSGLTRLGAERASSTFTQAEQDGIVAAFDAIQGETGFSCVRIGVDTWKAGR